MYSASDTIFISLMFIIAVDSFIRALREKEKVYYLVALGSLLSGLSIIFLNLNQLLPFILLFASAVLLGFVGLTKRLKLAEREYVKLLYEIDSSTPLRVQNIFTSNFWLVMASRWGVWETVLLRCLLTLAIIGGVHYIFNLLGIIDMTFVVINTLAASMAFAAYHSRAGSRLRFISMREFVIYLIIVITFSTITLYPHFSKVF